MSTGFLFAAFYSRAEACSRRKAKLFILFRINISYRKSHRRNEKSGIQPGIKRRKKGIHPNFRIGKKVMHDFHIKIACGKNRKADFHNCENRPENYRKFFAFKRNFSEAENRCKNKGKNYRKLGGGKQKPYKISAADHKQKR